MTNAQLMAGRLADLLRRERTEMAEFLLALAEFDRARGWLELGYESLFHFLHRSLGLSKGVAFYRKTAAELIQNYPEVLEPLRDGRLCITSVVHVAKVLTADNRHDVLPRFFQRSRRDARAVAAAIRPSAAPHRDVVTAASRADSAAQAAAGHPAAADTAVQPGEPVQPAEPAGPVAGEPPPPLPPPPPAVARRDSSEPLTASLSRLHVTVSQRFLDKLEAAREVVSDQQAGANAEAILEAGLDLLLERHAARKGLVKNPRKPGKSGAPGSRYIPASVRREVWKRDGGCCQWPLEFGGICASRKRLRFDHIVPVAMGGPSTGENIRLLCEFHNDLAARRAFGDAWMNQFTRDPRAAPRGPRA